MCFGVFTFRFAGLVSLVWAVLVLWLRFLCLFLLLNFDLVLLCCWLDIVVLWFYCFVALVVLFVNCCFCFCLCLLCCCFDLLDVALRFCGVCVCFLFVVFFRVSGFVSLALCFGFVY